MEISTTEKILKVGDLIAKLKWQSKEKLHMKID